VLQELESCYDLAQQNQKDHLLEAWTQRRITP